jgi:hypothetical protein
MEFNPVTHTKDRIIANIDILLELVKSKDFALSEMSQDKDLLKVALIRDGQTLAHRLAAFQPEWVKTSASQDVDVLRISMDSGLTVAHALAGSRSEWATSNAAEDFTILKLKDSSGISVAHTLAQFQSNWLNSKSSKNIEILSLKDNSGTTVAHKFADYEPKWLTSNEAKNLEVLMYQNDFGETVAGKAVAHPECLLNECIFNKKILSIYENKKLLAETIFEKYGKKNGWDLTFIIMKMISQGAAYKHSKPVSDKTLKGIIKNTKELISDCCDPLISLRYAQALYSTCYHCIKNSGLDAQYFSEFDKCLEASAEMIRQLLSKHPELVNSEIGIDIYCEPSDLLLKRIIAENTFSMGNDNFSKNDVSTDTALGLY